MGKNLCCENQIEIHEFISLAVSFEHDVLDGAPAAWFIRRLKKLVENGSVLRHIS